MIFDVLGKAKVAISADFRGNLDKPPLSACEWRRQNIRTR
jgi:hypothetical protein